MIGAFGSLFLRVEKQSMTVSFSSAKSINTFVSAAMIGGCVMPIDYRHALLNQNGTLLVGEGISLGSSLLGDDRALAFLILSVGLFHEVWVRRSSAGG